MKKKEQHCIALLTMAGDVCHCKKKTKTMKSLSQTNKRN